MAADKTIKDLDDHLAKILKVLESSAKAQGVTGAGSGGTQSAPKTLTEHFTKGFEKASKQNDLGGMANKLGSSFGGTNVGKIAGGTAGAGNYATAFIEGMKAWYTASEKVREFAGKLHEANRQFAAFSPGMAQVFAVSDMQDRLRKMRQGDQLASSASGLAQARNRLEEQLTPIDTQWQRFQNRLGETITGATATFLEKSEFGKQLTELMKQGNDFLFGEDPPEPPDKWIQELDKMVDRENNKRVERVQPVRNPPKIQGGDPRPNFPWDRPGGGGGDF